MLIKKVKGLDKVQKVKESEKSEKANSEVEDTEKGWKIFIDAYKYFITQNNEVCVKLKSGESGEKYVPVKSEEFKDRIRYDSYENMKLIKDDAINTIIKMIETKARYEAERIQSFMRIGEYNGNFYYDLGRGRFVEITDEGYKVVRNVPICFLSNETMLEQCQPKFDEKIDLWKLREFINVKTEDEFILLIINIISYFVPEIPHHILIFIGSQGSSKSTVCRMIKKIVDPSTVDIYSFPKNKEDLVLHLNNAYLVPYDNLNKINDEYNDILCQVATGGNFLKRKLYSDSGLMSYSLRRGLILNGINIATDQPDLLDRSIILHLKTIDSSERKTEKEIFDKFDKMIPYFLDNIFEAVSHAKEIYKDIEIKDLPRMADAVKWSCAIAEALGIKTKEYMRIYTDSQNNINNEILADNAVANAIIEFMKNRTNWKSSVTALWQKLEPIVIRNGMDKDSSWAKNASYLSRYINKLRANLEKVNISFEIVNVTTYKEIRIWKTGEKVKKSKTVECVEGAESAENKDLVSKSKKKKKKIESGMYEINPVEEPLDLD